MVKGIDTAARFYDHSRDWGELDEPNTIRVRQTLALLPAGVTTVLDVGCGDGAVTNPLVDDGIEVTGIDASEVALAHFRGRQVAGDIEKLPFEDNSFEVIICAEVLEHLPGRVYARVLPELERVASKAIIVTTPYQEYLPHSFVKCSGCATLYHSSHHVRNYSREDYEQLFSGFALEQSIGICEWRQNSLNVALKHFLGVHIWRDNLVCPVCDYDRGEPEPSWIQHPVGTETLKRGLLGLQTVFERCFPGRTKNRWIAGLFLPRKGT